jgi:hypothetical protein
VKTEHMHLSIDQKNRYDVQLVLTLKISVLSRIWHPVTLDKIINLT